MEVSIPKKVNFHQDWWNLDYEPIVRKFLGIQFGQRKAKKQRIYDSKFHLEELGFVVLGLDPYFPYSYRCIMPEGWSTKENGYTTEYYNPEGKLKISQFDKYSSYDSAHFVDFF